MYRVATNGVAEIQTSDSSRTAARKSGALPRPTSWTRNSVNFSSNFSARRAFSAGHLVVAKPASSRHSDMSDLSRIATLGGRQIERMKVLLEELPVRVLSREHLRSERFLMRFVGVAELTAMALSLKPCHDRAASPRPRESSR